MKDRQGREDEGKNFKWSLFIILFTVGKKLLYRCKDLEILLQTSPSLIPQMILEELGKLLELLLL